MASALHAYDRLIAARFTDDQARAILDAQADEVATKEHLDAKLASLKNELIVWMIGIATTLVGIQVTFFLVLLSRIH